MIAEYTDVRIVSIAGEAAERLISSSHSPPRLPQVGDTATVVDVRGNGEYILEAVQGDGRARWVAWFYERELEEA